MFYKSPFPKTIKMTEMKKNNRNFILFAILLLFNACSDGWDSESQELFHQSCMEDAKERGLDDTKARSVCDCRLETAQKKYPTLSYAMANVEKMMNDEDLKKCE